MDHVSLLKSFPSQPFGAAPNRTYCSRQDHLPGSLPSHPLLLLLLPLLLHLLRRLLLIMKCLLLDYWSPACKSGWGDIWCKSPFTPQHDWILPSMRCWLVMHSRRSEIACDSEGELLGEDCQCWGAVRRFPFGITKGKEEHLSQRGRLSLLKPFAPGSAITPRFSLKNILSPLLGDRLPWWLTGYGICLQCRRHRRRRFDPWVGKFPWRRKMETHSTVLAWKIPWTEEPGRLQSKWSWGIRHNWATNHTLMLLDNTPETLPLMWSSFLGLRRYP